MYMHRSAAAAVVLREKVTSRPLPNGERWSGSIRVAWSPLCTAVPSVLSLPCAQRDSSKKGNHAVPVESYLFVSADCSALIKSLRASIIRSVSQAGARLRAPVACSRIKHAQAGSVPEQTGS